MASGYFREARGYWVAAFRGLHQGGKDRTRLRVPDARIRSPTMAKRDADTFAEELDRYCRLLEGSQRSVDVEHARRIGAITDAQAAALLAGADPVPRRSTIEPPSIIDAALKHPSSSRDGWSQAKYLRHLDAYVAYAGSKQLADLSIEGVLAWVAELHRRGLAWDTRRHYLLYLRRATRMAPSFGLPDVLSRLKIDHRESQPVDLAHWTLPQLLAGLAVLEKEKDPRAAAALALTGLLGLRPTELCRLQVGDLDLAKGCLRVGARTAKNAASRRALPIPRRLEAVLRAVAGKRPESDPLLQTASPGRRGPFSLDTISTWWAAVTDGKLKPAMPPKIGRKSFATWARDAGADGQHLEAWIGHRSAFFSAVSTRHYLAGYQLDALRPMCRLLEAAMDECSPAQEADDEGILSYASSD